MLQSTNGTAVPRRDAYNMIGALALACSVTACAESSVMFVDDDPADGPIRELVLEPAQVTIAANDSTSFQALGYSSTHETTEVLVSWSTTEGDIKGNGKGNAFGAYEGSQRGKHKVIATDTSGVADTATVTVSEPPTAAFTFVAADLEVMFTDGSSAGDQSIESWMWDFGDGTGTSTDPGPSYTYAAEGSYEVNLTVTAADGLTDEATRIVSVSAAGEAPSADFTFTTSDLEVTFTDASSDSDGTVTSWSWDFGDGIGSSSLQNPSYTFASAGSYDVVLTITDNDGRVGEVTRTVDVTAAGQSGGLPVIPGAYGFGMDTPAGRFGRVLRVTSLEDDPSDPRPGTLRHAVLEEGPRVIVFEVSGTIDLEERLRIGDPFLTIAGQTAPSPGITLRGHHMSIRTHDVLIQHIRIRAGDLSGGEPDAVQVENSGSQEVYNVVLDHCSFSWAVDENTSTWGYLGERVHDVTFRNLLISEALDDSDHEKGPHSKGMLIGDGNERIAVLGNIFAHNADRNPEFKGGATGVVVNNLIYNWDPDQQATHLSWEEHLPGMPVLLSVVGNVYLRGPDMPLSSEAYAVEVFDRAPSNSRLYLDDNVHPDIILFHNEASFDPRVDTRPIWVDGLTARAGSTVESWILNRAGARPAERDAVDRRVIDEIRTRSGRIIDSQADVGGWPVLPVNRRTLELPPDPNGDDDGDGYTNLEEWLYQFSVQVGS